MSMGGVDRRTRVIMVGPSLKVRGGISASAAALLSGLPADAPRVTYVATQIDGSRSLKTLAALLGMLRLFCLLALRRADIVHVHMSTGASFIRKSAVLAMARMFGCRTITHVHAGRFPKFFKASSPARQKTIVRDLEESDLVLALTEEWKGRLAEIAPRANIRVLMNSIRASQFEAVIPDRPPVPENGGSLLFLGWIVKDKGVLDLAEALALVVSERPEITVEFGGDRDVEMLRTRVASLGLTDRVRILGWVMDDQKLDTLRRAHVFVLPSYAEGLPMAMLEAMAAGLPLITTPVGGIPEVVRDGENGILIEPGDVEALAGSILALLGDEGLRERMATANVEVIRREHDARAVAAKLCLWYDEIMGE